MPNNKRKNLSKIKGKDKAHPYSRKATQMRRAINRQARLETEKSKRFELTSPKGQKFLWFRDNLDESICPYTREDLAILIKAYLARNDDEIKEILEQRRPGRPLTPKQQLILTAAETERKEAMRGALDVPNLMDVKTLKLLHNWDGDMNSMHMITETRIKVDLGQDSDNDGDSGSKARSASNISEIDKAIETETGMLVA